MKNNEAKYSLTAKIFHWGFVIFFAYGIFKAVEDLDQLKDPSFLRFEFLFASAFIGLLTVRYFYMRKTQETSIPENSSQAQKLAAKLVHLGMYVTLGLIAITGMIIGALFKMGFESGILIEFIITVHEFGIPVMYWLVAIHVSAALYHRFLKDGVWNSMVPFWRE